jgi:alpha-tubulin suppressor-like RCC1 family protein
MVATSGVLALVAAVAGSGFVGTSPGSSVDAAPPGRHGIHLLAGSALPSRALYGWGGNDSGQIGVGSVGGDQATGVTVPARVAVAGGTTVTSVAAGGAFSVGLTTTGAVEAWGSGLLGELGGGTTVSTPTPAAVRLPVGTVATQVVAGSSHALALTSTGTVYAWGVGIDGQLGDGSTQNRDVPTPVALPAGTVVTHVAAGGDHSLALTSTGQLYAWGDDLHGDLGDGATVPEDTPVPVTPPPGLTFTAIAAGTTHSAAVASDGSVWAWGMGASGQLGDGSTADAVTPTAVAMPAGTPVSQVAAGGAHTLALTTGGLVFDWGSDVFGQLATPLVLAQPVDSDVPVQPSGLPRSTPYVAIAAGQDSSYALTSDGVPWAWGGDYYGQLADGSPGLNGIVPAPLTTLPPGTLATGLFAGPDASAAFLVTRSEQTVTFPPITAPTYGDPPVNALATASSGLGVTGAETGSCTGALAHLLLVGTGPCTVTATQAGSFDFYPATATTTFTVAAAVLQVTPDPVTGTAGQPLPALTYRLTGFKDGDTVAVVSGRASCTTTAQAGSYRGTYLVTCSPGTLSAAHYVFRAGPAATLTIAGASGGYAVVGKDGSIWTEGSPSPGFHGSMAGTPLAAPVVGAAYTPLHDGYWMAATDGGIFSFGTARFAGSMGGHPLNRPIVGMAATPDGGGYWEVASDGGIFAFGDAGFFGSAGATPLVAPIVGMATTADGQGYWLVAADGGIFAYGDASFYGSAGGQMALDPVVGMAPTGDGHGYWFVTRAGAVFPYGDAVFEGSLRYVNLTAPVVGIAPTGDARGYWLVGADGGVFAFGDASFLGGVSDPPAPIAGII